MKKLLFYSMLFAGGMCLTTACSDEENTDGNGGDGTPSEIVTSTQAQQELDRVGRQLMEKVDADKLKPVIQLADFCDRTFFNDDDEVYPVEPDEVPLTSFMHNVKALAQGDIARIATKRMTKEIYDLSQYYATFTWDENAERWIESSNSEALVYKFNHAGSPCIVTVKGSGRTYEIARKDSTGYVFDTAKIPEHITATITEGSSTIAQMAINTTECDQDGKKFAINTAFTAAGYTIAAEMTDNNTQAQANVTFLSGNELLITAKCSLDGRDLADLDKIYNDQFPESDLHKAGLICDILNDVQIKISADNTDGLSEKTDFDGYYYYYETKNPGDTATYVHKYSDNETAQRLAQTAADASNQYIKAALYFTNGTYCTPMKWQPYHMVYEDFEGDNGWGGYSIRKSGEWVIDPVMVFDGETTYTFGNFFTEARFSSLVEMYNDLMRDFDEIF